MLSFLVASTARTHRRCASLQGRGEHPCPRRQCAVPNPVVLGRMHGMAACSPVSRQFYQTIIQQMLYYWLMQEAQVIRSLAALAHEARLRVFRALVVAGPEGLTPSALAEQLGIAPNALSFHLKELFHAELVSQERQGRNVLYRAAFPAMNGLLAYMTENCCQGAACTPAGAASCHC